MLQDRRLSRRHGGCLRCTILSTTTILFTMVSSSLITTVINFGGLIGILFYFIFLQVLPLACFMNEGWDGMIYQLVTVGYVGGPLVRLSKTRKCNN